MPEFPSTFHQGESDAVPYKVLVPKAMRDSLKYKAIHENTTLQAIGYSALRAAALEIPPPLPSARCIEAVGNFRAEIQAAYPIGDPKRKRIVALLRELDAALSE